MRRQEFLVQRFRHYSISLYSYTATPVPALNGMISIQTQITVSWTRITRNWLPAWWSDVLGAEALQEASSSTFSQMNFQGSGLFLLIIRLLYFFGYRFFCFF
jgi:hypothetical protein